MKRQGFAIEEVDAAKLGKKDIHVKKLTLSPFYWGFDIGMNMPAEDVYKMLKIVDKHADDLAKLDGDFAQIAGGNLAAFQVKALGANVGPRPHSPRSRKVPEGKGQVGHEVGLQSRHDVMRASERNEKLRRVRRCARLSFKFIRNMGLT